MSMEEAFQLANTNIEKSADYNKRHYDKNIKEVEILPGDQVLVRNMREKGGTGKLKSYWEQQIFQVIEKKANLPVYKIRSLSNKGDIRVIHRNLMMKCNELAEDVFEERKMKIVGDKRKKEDKLKKEDGDDDNLEDENSEDLEVRIYHDGSRAPLEGERVDVDDGMNHNAEEENDHIGQEEVLGSSSEDESFYGFEEEDEPADETVVSSEEDTDGKPPLRRSARNKVGRKVFTYDKVGGEPSEKEGR